MRATARKIQQRLVVILRTLPHRTKVVKAPRIPKAREQIEHLFALSSHVAITPKSGAIRCARCLNSFVTSHPAAKEWLKAPCPAIGRSIEDRPVAVPYQTVHAGHRHTHHSQNLHMFRGLMFCVSRISVCNLCACDVSLLFSRASNLSSSLMPSANAGLSFCFPIAILSSLRTQSSALSQTYQTSNAIYTHGRKTGHLPPILMPMPGTKRCINSTFCGTCVARNSKKLQLLAINCKPSKAYGLNTLKPISKRNLPCGINM